MLGHAQRFARATRRWCEHISMVMGDIQEGLDVVVIGAGPGGYVAAIRAAQLGRQVTLVDAQAKPGGICLHEGCIPSKALIHVAEVYQGIADAKDFGIEVSGRSLNIAKMQEWRVGIIDRLARGILQLCKDNKVSLVHGRVQFVSGDGLVIETEAGKKSYQFKHAIIATGSVAASLPDLPFDATKKIFSSKEALEWKEIPKRLVIIGGGYIGIELGTVYAKFGSSVTIVEAKERILPEVDQDIAKVVAKRLNELGVILHTSTRVASFDGNRVFLEAGPVSGETSRQRVGPPGAGDRPGGTPETPASFKAGTVVVAVGRKPNTQGLGLEQAGIKVNERGFIVVNERQQTSQTKIYAIGDVAGEPMLAHKASAEGKVAAAAICGKKVAFDAVVPAVIFSDPEIASVGLTEVQAKEEGLKVQVASFPFAALGRSLASHAASGFVKIVAEADQKRILGIHMVGPHASELIAEATLAVEMGCYADDLSLTIHTHPTFAEALSECAELLYGYAIHLSPRKQAP